MIHIKSLYRYIYNKVEPESLLHRILKHLKLIY